MQQPAGTRDHGGDVSALRAQFGGAAADWLDLSTGINAIPYPPPTLTPAAWTRLPQREAEVALIAAARSAYAVPPTADVVTAAGAQALIELLPRLAARRSGTTTPTPALKGRGSREDASSPSPLGEGLGWGRSGTAEIAGRCAIVSPTYNEHAASFRAAGWTVEEVSTPVSGFDALVVVNPNNPDGRSWDPWALLDLLPATGLLVVDESFADAASERSVAPHAGDERLVVLRSFGKFYGLAGVRLGFAITGPVLGAALRTRLGLWSTSGPALEIGAVALADVRWADETRLRLIRDAARLDAILTSNGLSVLGGTSLFRLAQSPHAAAIQTALAHRHIAVRSFPYAPHWLRFGLPGGAADWGRLAESLVSGHPQR